MAMNLSIQGWGKTLAVLLLSQVFAAPIAGAAIDPVVDWTFDPSFPSGYVSKVASDSHGNVYACSGSNTVSVHTGVHMFQVSKIDASGALLWQRSFAPSGGWAERANWLAVDSEDNVLVTGWALPLQSSIRDLVTLKYDPVGNLLWERRFTATTSSGNIGHRVELDAADHVYVFASGSGGGGTSKILKYDPAGNLEWLRGNSPPGASIISSRSMKVTPAGDVAYLVGVNHVDFHTRAYDTLGNLLFENTYLNGVNGGDDLAWGPGGELYVCGAGAIGGTLPVAPVVVKYEATGTFAWERGYVGPLGASGIFRRMATDSVGNIIAVGFTQSGAALPYVDWATVKYDPAGNELWSRWRAGFGGNDEYLDWVEIGADNSVYVAGQAGKLPTNTCTLFPGTGSDVETTVIRYDPNGAEQWIAQVDCSGLPSSLTLTPFEALIVTTPSEIVRIVQNAEFTSFCFGDGGNQLGCTDCPCLNNAPTGSGAGCLNSSGNGTRLSASGSTSVSLPSGGTSDLRFSADGAPSNAFCILSSGDAVAPSNMANPCFGLNSGVQSAQFDGLRCAVGNTLRHGGRSADANGDVGVTGDPWGGEGAPTVGLAQQGAGFAAGQTRYFQVINRDDPLAVCTHGMNTSQAVEVTFSP